MEGKLIILLYVAAIAVASSQHFWRKEWWSPCTWSNPAIFCSWGEKRTHLCPKQEAEILPSMKKQLEVSRHKKRRHGSWSHWISQQQQEGECLNEISEQIYSRLHVSESLHFSASIIAEDTHVIEHKCSMMHLSFSGFNSEARFPAKFGYPCCEENLQESSWACDICINRQGKSHSRNPQPQLVSITDRQTDKRLKLYLRLNCTSQLCYVWCT